MGTTNIIGDIGETSVVLDCLKKGYKVSIPFGHNTQYDLIVDRNNKLERLQVKTTSCDGKLSNLDQITIRTTTVHSIGKGKTKESHYTNEMIDWIVIVDLSTSNIYYVPIDVVSDKRKTILWKNRPVDKSTYLWHEDFLEW